MQSFRGISLYDWASHFIPIVRWLPSYKWRENLLGDVVAALTVTAVAAPEAVSYAGIAGLHPQQGLYTGLLGPLAYALAGASPQLMVGPTAIMCILTHNAIPLRWGGQAVAACDHGAACAQRTSLAGLLALAMALLQALIGALRLGSLVTLISQPVVVGFTTGSALLTASSQFATLFALQTGGVAAKCAATDAAGEPIGCTFGQAVADVFARWDTINWGVVGLGCACVALLCGVRALPAVLGQRAALLASLAPLVLVLVIAPLAYAHQDFFCARLGQCVTPIPSGLPPLGHPLATLAAGSPSDWGALLAAALPLAIIGYMGAVTIAKTIARQYGPYAVYADSELWGQVAANAACGLGSALPVTGSFSRSAVNCSSGARSGAASLLTAAAMGLALLALTQPLAYIPPVARSAIVLVAIGKMVELHMLSVFWGGERRDAAVFVVTLGVVLFADSASGLAAGVALQWLLALLRHSGEPTRVRVHAWVRGGLAVGAPAPPPPQLQPRSPASSAADAALLAMRAQGLAWKDVTGEATLSSQGLQGVSVGGGAEEAAAGGAAGDAASGSGSAGAQLARAFPHPAVTLQWAPDVHFASSERLCEAAGEAVALLAPAALLLNLGGVTPGAGLFLDATGAAELHTLTHTLPARCAVIVYGLSEASLAHLASLAGGGKGGGKEGGSSASASGSWRGACAAAVARGGGGTLGRLHVCASAAAAEGAALEICALARVRSGGGGGVGGSGSGSSGGGAAAMGGSLQAGDGGGGGGGSGSCWESEEEEAEEGAGEAEGAGGAAAEGEAEAGAALLLQRPSTTRARRAARPVQGVPPSPLAVRSTRARLALGLQPSAPPSFHMAQFKAGVAAGAAGRAAEEGSGGACAGAARGAAALGAEAADLARQAWRYLSGEAPLLVAAASEE